MILFSLPAYQRNQERAQRAKSEPHFLFAQVAQELEVRLQEAGKTQGPALNLSPFPLSQASYRQSMSNILAADREVSPMNLVTQVTEGESGRGANPDLEKESLYELRLPTDELPFPEGEFERITSCLQAHWVGDLPALLAHIKRCLRPGGLFLAALGGGQTLHELRESFVRAEVAVTGGASPRVAPMLHPADAPLLLSRAGFIDPVVDTENLKVHYKSVWALMRDLRGMGETNILEERKKTFSSRSVFRAMEAIYHTTFGSPEGTIPATFEIIYLTGWA